MEDAEMKPCCECCGREFVRCAYNGHKQRYCKVASCVEQRRRVRQSQRYKTKYRTEADFRNAEQARCLKALHARRRQVPAEQVAATGPSTEMLFHVITGLLAHLADSNDSGALAEQSRALERRGQRLAAAGRLCGAMSAKANVEEIFRPSFEVDATVPLHSL